MTQSRRTRLKDDDDDDDDDDDCVRMANYSTECIVSIRARGRLRGKHTLGNNKAHFRGKTIFPFFLFAATPGEQWDDDDDDDDEVLIHRDIHIQIHTYTGVSLLGADKCNRHNTQVEVVRL